MVDFIIDVLFMRGAVWLWVGAGALVAAGAWFLLPEAMDRATIGAWCITLGFLGGLMCCLPLRKEK